MTQWELSESNIMYLETELGYFSVCILHLISTNVDTSCMY